MPGSHGRATDGMDDTLFYQKNQGSFVFYSINRCFLFFNIRMLQVSHQLKCFCVTLIFKKSWRVTLVLCCSAAQEPTVRTENGEPVAWALDTPSRLCPAALGARGEWELALWSRPDPPHSQLHGSNGLLASTAAEEDTPRSGEMTSRF